MASWDKEVLSSVGLFGKHKGKRRRHHRDHAQGEFKKAKSPTFDGEVKLDKRLKLGFLG